MDLVKRVWKLEDFVVVIEKLVLRDLTTFTLLDEVVPYFYHFVVVVDVAFCEVVQV